MTTATAERREYTLFDLVNHLVWEARHNDGITKQYGNQDDPDLFPSTGKLLESLTRQGPNRIYFGPDGKICRVLFFSEESLPFQARIETLQLQPAPKIVKSECFVATTSVYLENEISWWRRQFGMSGDLLLNPTFVMESSTTGDFVHLGKIKRQMSRLSITDFVWVRYYLSPVNGPRVTDLGIGIWPATINGEIFKLLSSRPPETIVRYANPFANPLPR